MFLWMQVAPFCRLEKLQLVLEKGVCGIATCFMRKICFQFASMSSWDRKVELFWTEKVSLVNQRTLKQHRLPACVCIYVYI